MTDGRNFRLIVASNALWCTHVSPIYWRFFHLKLQKFTFSGMLLIIYYCHLALFYLWYHHMLGFCNLFCDNMCEVQIGWTMIDCCNFCLMVTSNVLWCAHVSTVYWTFCHQKLQNFTLSGIMQIVCCCHLVLLYLWHHHTSRFYNLS